jgi:hypothetical protein
MRPRPYLPVAYLWVIRRHPTECCHPACVALASNISTLNREICARNSDTQYSFWLNKQLSSTCESIFQEEYKLSTDRGGSLEENLQTQTRLPKVSRRRDDWKWLTRQWFLTRQETIVLYPSYSWMINTVRSGDLSQVGCGSLYGVEVQETQSLFPKPYNRYRDGSRFQQLRNCLGCSRALRQLRAW